jgi:HK97 family phage major capsid protein
MSVLSDLREKRAALSKELRDLTDLAKTETRDLTPDEATSFDEKIEQRDQLDVRIGEEEAKERRQARIDEVRKSSGSDHEGRAVVTREEQVYGKGSRNSYFLDLARAQIRGDADALERLTRHAAELDVEVPKREAAREARAARQIEEMGRLESRDFGNPFEKRTNPNRTDGTGGYFVPPLWLVDEYIPLLRNGRPFANSVRNMDLPSGTDSINIPKVATGTATGVQTADAAAVTSTDLTDSYVTAPVRTIAGQQDVAMQLLDQSPVAFDEIVFTDLIADYNARVDVQCLSGSGASGQLKGVDNVSGVNAITYTQASPTAATTYPVFAQALSQLATNRKRPATAIFLHARRWYWLASLLDSSNRPLVTPFANAAQNPMSIIQGIEPEGPVGQVLGVPIMLDMNIATNVGSGTNQDVIYAARTPDLYLWEGSMRTRTLTEILSGTLQVRFQLYNYLAFMADRYPVATSIVNGTGLVAPSGF